MKDDVTVQDEEKTMVLEKEKDNVRTFFNFKVSCSLNVLVIFSRFDLFVYNFAFNCLLRNKTELYGDGINFKRSRDRPRP